MFHINIDNVRKIDCDKLNSKIINAKSVKADDLQVDNFIVTLPANSQNPNIIGTTADSIQKLNEATLNASLLNTSNAPQTKFGGLEIVSPIINNREALKIRSPYSSVTGDEVGIKFESSDTDDITLYKNSSGLVLNKQNEGDNIIFSDDIELLKATGAFKVGNTVIENNNITIGETGGNKTLDMANNNGGTILDLQSSSFTSLLFSGFRIEQNAGDPSKLKITNGNGTSALFSIDQNGRIGLGGNEPNSNIQINMKDADGSLRLPHYTTLQRDTLLIPSQGMIIYNSTLQSVQSYNGTRWSDAHLHEELSSNIHGVTSDIMGVNDAQTIINKNIDADNNNITNIENDNIKVAANIDVLKLGTGLVNNTTFNYLANVTSDIQTQINNAGGGGSVTPSSTNTFFNKTISADSNTISNIRNASIAPSANIDATKISTGQVNNTQFSYLSGATSNIQQQINTLSGSSVSASSTTTFFNKTLSAFNNNIINLRNINIDNSAAIDVTKLSNGQVNNTQFNHLSGVTSNIQQQFNNLTAGGVVTGSSNTTFFNKTMSGFNNTFTNIQDASLSNNIVRLNNANTFTQTQTIPILNITGSLQYLGVDMTLARDNSNDIFNPSPSNNLSQGYSRLSRWVNTTDDSMWSLVDFSGSNSIWKQHVFTDSVLTSINTSSILNNSGDITINPSNDLNILGDIKINNTRVLASQQPPVSDATNSTDVVTRFNELLLRLRGHGLIAS